MKRREFLRRLAALAALPLAGFVSHGTCEVSPVFGKNLHRVVREAQGTLVVFVPCGSKEYGCRLNALAEEIWDNLDGRTSLATIMARLAKRYRIPTAELEKPVAELLAGLRLAGAVQLQRSRP